MKSIKTDQRGVSLVELVITISLVSILSIILMNFMVNWMQQHAVTQTRSALLASAQDSLDFITDSVRLASSADQNNRWQDTNAPNAPANLQSWQSGANVLILATAAENLAGNILFSNPSNYTSHKNNQIYFLKNGALYRRTLASPVSGNKSKTSCPKTSSNASCPTDRKLSENVTNFTVIYLNAQNQPVQPTNARSVLITLTLQKKVFGKTIQSTDKTRMVFRND